MVILVSPLVGLQRRSTRVWRQGRAEEAQGQGRAEEAQAKAQRNDPKERKDIQKRCFFSDAPAVLQTLVVDGPSSSSFFASLKKVITASIANSESRWSIMFFFLTTELHVGA